MGRMVGAKILPDAGDQVWRLVFDQLVLETDTWLRSCNADT